MTSNNHFHSQDATLIRNPLRLAETASADTPCPLLLYAQHATHLDGLQHIHHDRDKLAVRYDIVFILVSLGQDLLYLPAQQNDQVVNVPILGEQSLSVCKRMPCPCLSNRSTAPQPSHMPVV
jgi:hypothetical protein